MTVKPSKNNGKVVPLTDPAPSVPAPVPQKPASAPALLSDREFLFMQGEVVWLMGRSPKHRHLFIADLDWLVAPPLALKQVRIYRNQSKPADRAAAPSVPVQPDGTPVVFVSWAFVSDEVNERLKAGIIRLQPAEWRSGTHPWIIDVVAPFGGAEQAVANVVKDVFGGKVVPVAGGKPASAVTATPLVAGGQE